MIPVTPAPPPADFDDRVKNPGIDAIAELIGAPTSTVRRGRKRKKVANRPADIPSDKFPPLWREVLPDMLDLYHRRCAYLALYIEHSTGSPSVDHVIPKSKDWDKVYEWSNYRLVCALVNARKGNLEGVLDPFTIVDGLFAMEFVEFQVKLGDAAVGGFEAQVEDTIEKLGLNLPDCCKARREYVENYEAELIKLVYLERRAPFIARELRRQGFLLPGDV